jgi:hypothetical protein
MAAWGMDLTSALIALGILVGVAVVFLALWDVLLAPVITFALKLALYAAAGGSAFLLATMLF